MENNIYRQAMVNGLRPGLSSSSTQGYVVPNYVNSTNQMAVKAGPPPISDEEKKVLERLTILKTKGKTKGFEYNMGLRQLAAFEQSKKIKKGPIDVTDEMMLKYFAEKGGSKNKLVKYLRAM